MHNLNILYERRRDYKCNLYQSLKNHTSNDISDSVFSVFLWPLALCRHIKCWSSLKTHSCSSFQLDFDPSPTIDNLIISRFLYPHLTCPNSYSKFILELRKLRSQRHLTLNTSKWNCYLMPYSNLASGFSLSITVPSSHLVFKLKITPIGLFAASCCTHFGILEGCFSALSSLLANPLSHLSLYLPYVSTGHILSFYHQYIPNAVYNPHRLIIIKLPSCYFLTDIC